MSQTNLQLRLSVARDASEAVGGALLAMRGRCLRARAGEGGQLKTVVDDAAEAWILAALRNVFGGEIVLAEEQHQRSDAAWHARSDYWTVDAVDGTRSFADGFDGFCVQVAWVQGGVPVVGVIHEPAFARTLWAVRGRGAFVDEGNGAHRLSLAQARPWPARPRFVDSLPPAGAVGLWMQSLDGRFVECGGVGCKIVRVALGEAHVYAKDFRFKLWDVAPGQVILDECGAQLGLWSGGPLNYGGAQVTYQGLLATPRSLFAAATQALAAPSAGGHKCWTPERDQADAAHLMNADPANGGIR